MRQPKPLPTTCVVIWTTVRRRHAPSPSSIDGAALHGVTNSGGRGSPAPRQLAWSDCSVSALGTGHGQRSLRSRTAEGGTASQYGPCAVNELGGSAAEALRWIPGTEPVRQQMLDATLEYYESFLRYADHQPALRADCARIQSQRGLLLDHWDERANRRIRMRRRRKCSIACYANTRPTMHCGQMPPSVPATTAQCWCNWATGRAAARNYHTAISEQSALLAGAATEQRGPDNRLAQSYLNLGRLHTQMRQLVPAEQALSAALALLAQDTAITPTRPTIARRWQPSMPPWQPCRTTITRNGQNICAWPSACMNSDCKKHRAI